MGAVFGIAGNPDQNVFHRMGEALLHRGGAGQFESRSSYALIGYHARFEAPLRKKQGAGIFEKGNISLALSGYLTSTTDSENILESLYQSYREEGIAFIKKLRGAFVLVIRDHKTIYLVRDGAGARTVYYGAHQKGLYFAEEPKGILAAPEFPRRIRPGAVAQYLTFSFVPGHHTMLEEIHELPPGHFAKFVAGEVALERYFFFEHLEGTSEQSEQEWIYEFKQAFRAAISDRLQFSETPNVYLSGGIDSSVVVAELAKQSSQPVKTYAIHFGKKYDHELDFARAVANRCGTDHEEVLIQPKGFLGRFRKMIWHLDDPIGDPITMPNFELSSQVARGTKQIFNGEGGDPLFGGPKNLPMMLHHWYGVPRDPFYRERQYLASYRRAYEELEPLLSAEWKAKFKEEEVLEKTLTPFFEAEKPKLFLNKLMNINIRLKGGHLILPKVDKMTAAWGMTAHSPLFDERLIELSFKMPAKLKLDRGDEKVILKKTYADALPEEVIRRPKSGMRVPVYYWFQKEMKRYAKSILSPKKVKRSGIFNPERVKQLLAYDTEDGPGRYGIRLWMLLTFEVWRRIVVEGEPV